MTNSWNDLDPPPARSFGVAINAARRVADRARASAEALDVDGAFPTDEVRALADEGLLTAPLPQELGGSGLLAPDGAEALANILEALGGGSLSLGRLYEGHVNALALIACYGRPGQLARHAAAVRDGGLFAVWNTERDKGVRLIEEGQARFRLDGAKVFASGAGFVDHPLITAQTASGGVVMLVAPRGTSDLSQWRAHGMRASASGRVDFSGAEISGDAIIGAPGDFQRQPMLSAGAWRFAAVQLGAIGGLLDLARAHLIRSGRNENPYQLARIGEAAIAVETARLWVFRAGARAQSVDADPEASVAYVNMARLAVERAGLDVIQLTHRSIGLAAFLRSNPVERLTRDLATYLRQPAPDEALSDAARFVLKTDRPIADMWAETWDERLKC